MMRLCLSAVVAVVLAMPAAAATWAEALFDGLTHDFGSVARGPTLTHSFRITNTTGSTIHIAGVRVSCGCVTATALTSTLPPGQATEIQAHVDTRRFSGAKTVTIFVQFDRPAWDEVRLTVSANGHDELTVTPETLSFGSVVRGQGATRTATVRIVGVGTHLVNVQSDSNYVQLAARTVRAADAELVYEVSAAIRPDIPAGKWFTDIWLRTDNPNLPRVRVPLSVDVTPALQVSSSAAFGSVPVGETREKRIIIRGPQPFRIVGIAGADDAVSVRVAAEDSRPVHVLTVALKAQAPGPLARTLRIATDLPTDGVLELPATATIGEPSRGDNEP